MFWSFLTTMATDTHSNNANNSLQRDVCDESAFYDDFEPRKIKKTKQYRIEYLTTQKTESDGPIRIFVIAKLRFMDVSFPRTFVPENESAS